MRRNVTSASPRRPTTPIVGSGAGDTNLVVLDELAGDGTIAPGHALRSSVALMADPQQATADG